MNYKGKYLKYKLKYLNLRNKFSGGVSPAWSNIEIPQINRRLLKAAVSNINQLEFINNQFQFNSTTGIINMITRPEGVVMPHMVPMYTRYAMTHLVNLGKMHFLLKQGDDPQAMNNHKYLEGLLPISRVIPNVLLVSYLDLNTHTNIKNVLDDFDTMYNSYTSGSGEMEEVTVPGINVLNSCGFLTEARALEMGNGAVPSEFIEKIIDEEKLDAFKYIINIAKIHLQYIRETLISLENNYRVNLDYRSAVNYFKVTLTDFFKIGFINKFLEIDEDVYKDSLESYNMLVRDTGLEVLRTMNVTMISDSKMDRFINEKVLFFWDTNGIEGKPIPL